eukprot:1705775-Ditylum_brightwellii.AAC.1
MPRKACHNAGLGIRKKNCYCKYYTPKIYDREEKKTANKHECSSGNNDVGKGIDDVDDTLSVSLSCYICECEYLGEVEDDIVDDVSVGGNVNILERSDVSEG